MLQDGVANVPLANTTNPGVVIVGSGLKISSSNRIVTDYAVTQAIRIGTNNYLPLTPYNLNVFALDPPL